MRPLPGVMLAIAGAAVVGCGTTGSNRFNETTYADHNGPYDHETVYRSPAYGDRYDEDGRVIYVRPAYRVIPAPPDRVVRGDDGYYYYLD
ncbi:MAG TPA: hypothetical protein VFG64_13870 [Dongiaceae bacterium]|nr:hypothetical protein [Dongiaceae bacterium]